MGENRLCGGDRLEGDGSRALVSLLSAQKDGLPTPRSQPNSASSPQHICVVTETYPPEINGVALTLANLVKGLLARGHTVSVAHPKQQGQRTYNDAVEGKYSEAVQVRGLPLPGYHGLQFGVPAG